MSQLVSEKCMQTPLSSLAHDPDRLAHPPGLDCIYAWQYSDDVDGTPLWQAHGGIPPSSRVSDAGLLY